MRMRLERALWCSAGCATNAGPQTLQMHKASRLGGLVFAAEAGASLR
jgi:hypothetical protein